MTTLIMTLNREQGGNRESQVQPPYEVWERFFGISRSATQLPTFRIQSFNPSTPTETRKVVRHHHNLTIEISDARGERPAILVMKPDGANAFRYEVLRATSKDFRHYSWLLKQFGGVNENERRWLIIFSNE